MTDFLPLLPSIDDATPVAQYAGRLVRQGEFLRQVQTLAAQLPAAQALNLCADRYHFAVGLFAAISRGLESLLPNSLAPAQLDALREQTPAMFCLGDAVDNPAPDMRYLRIDANENLPVHPVAMPLIAANQIVARLHTSGSTGQPAAHRKTFGKLTLCSRQAARMLWQQAGGACSVIGTVPFQHTFGLEFTVLLPLLGGGLLTARTPFYPADIAAQLAEAPLPRLLVTTPHHLRNLLGSGIAMPALNLVLSATAPLSRDLAAAAERQLQTQLLEIYGSTETGQLAMRRPAHEEIWTALPGITLTQQEQGTLASGAHLETPQYLNDYVELLGPTRFRLIDRHANLINIAGKRSSLGFLNHVLTHLPGILDGVFFLPERHEQPARLAAFVVAPKLSTAEILQALRAHLDPVFLPRPLVKLESLPRDANGKLPQARLAELSATHLGDGKHFDA